MTRPLVLLLLALITASWSCADPVARVAASDAARVFGGCPEEGELYFEPPEQRIAATQRWLEVLARPTVPEDADLLEGERTVEVNLEVRTVLLDREGAQGFETLLIHNSFLEGIDWALSNDGRAFLALAPDEQGRELVSYVLVQTKDGRHFFPGFCEFRAMTSPLQARLGDRYDVVLARLPGMTDPDAVTALLVGPPGDEGPGPSEPVVLNPEDTPDSVLDELGQMSLALKVPKSWLGTPYTICTRIPLGWNDCVSLDQGSDPTFLLDAYVQDLNSLSIWLLDREARLTSPVQQLGVVSVSGSVGSLAALSAGGGTVVQVVLSGDLAVAAREDPVSDATVNVVRISHWNELLSDPRLYEQVTGEELDLTTEPVDDATDV